MFPRGNIFSIIFKIKVLVFLPALVIIVHEIIRSYNFKYVLYTNKVFKGLKSSVKLERIPYIITIYIYLYILGKPGKIYNKFNKNYSEFQPTFNSG